MKLKPIVTDTYDFPTLIRNGNVYVDKTAYLHRLVSKIDGTMFFMSRPRRFGKSPDEFLSVAGELRSGLESGDRSSEFIYKVLSVICEAPGLRRPALLQRVDTSEATMKRVLSTLTSRRLIEFRGAPKTGGYYALCLLFRISDDTETSRS